MSHVAKIPSPPASPADIANRLRKWHPRFVPCAVCTRPTAGFGFRDPHSKAHPRKYRWFCSKHCQALFAHKARKGMKMVDFTEEETMALPGVMRALAPVMESIGWERPLCQLTEQDMHRLIVTAIESFRIEMLEIAAKYDSEVPF